MTIFALFRTGENEFTRAIRTGGSVMPAYRHRGHDAILLPAVADPAAVYTFVFQRCYMCIDYM